MIRGEYKVVDEEEFLKYFMFEDRYNVEDLWPKKEVPDRLLYKLSKSGEQVVMEMPPDDLEMFEVNKPNDLESDERVIYLRFSDLIELSDKEIIKPLEDSQEVIFK